MFVKFTLRVKVLVLVLVITASMFSISLLGLQALKIASEKDNIARIEQLFKSTYSSIVQLEVLVRLGRLEEDKAKAIAVNILQENKYHDSEYVYVVDENLNFLAAPHDPQLLGSSFHDFKDANGRSVGALVENAARQGRGKMVNYDWTSERGGEVVYLTSVVQKTPDWGWYVGTGISFKEVDARYWSIARWLVSLSVIIAVLIAMGLYRFGMRLQRDLGAEISQVVSTVSKVSKGNLQGEFDEGRFSQGSIMGSITYMQRALKEVVREIGEVSKVLQTQVQDSESQSSELDTLASDLSRETQSIAATIDEISTTAQKVNDSVATTTESIAAAAEKGTQASKLTRESATIIGELETQIAKAGDSIHLLGNEVNNIEGVLQVIQGVAEQTNLLALNAAIEAARAGDQGRGFAVVADEVRQLAQRTSESTKEIHSMIERLQKVANDAIASVEISIATSESTVACSDQVSSALQDMFNLIDKTSKMSQSISQASRQQLDLAKQGDTRIRMIAKMSQDTAIVSGKANDKAELIRDSSNALQQEMLKFQV